MLAELEAELETLQKQNREVAYQQFIEGAWNGRPAAEMLTLAKEAGLKTPEADALIAKIRKGKENVAAVDQLPRLRKDANDARVQLKKISERNNEEISRLHGEIHHAECRNDDAHKAMRAATKAAQELLVLSDEGLLLTMHKEVTRLVDRRTAEQKYRKADSDRIDALEVRNRLRHIICNIQERIDNMPLTMTSEYDKDRLKEGLKLAQHDLAKAESELKDAEAVAEKMKKAIPNE